MKVDLVVDARYRSCPGPLLALAEAIAKANPGQVIMLLATDPAAPRDVKEWASSTNHKVLQVEKVDGEYRIYVEV
ncbi:MAG: sulfurtransferase TusA family protein [Candidatus Nezhaarchaeota archaeon]|nr:sulfurtransferase TusA family protein [Candidatus Nezhaarchaeota archaeon]MCX8141364.1 sulfurtransferase TusA family protein [Candidatus Nezhaarchaeota archaeon]MDW8049630.1 sulfurtransferase TusA family protein [Nitrososphaerota archaeon]